MFCVCACVHVKSPKDVIITCMYPPSFKSEDSHIADFNSDADLSIYSMDQTRSH